MGISEIRGTLFLGPDTKDPTILGYRIRAPDFRKLPDGAWQLQCLLYSKLALHATQIVTWEGAIESRVYLEDPES